MATVGIPGYSEIVKQAFLLEPLNGPKDTFYYLGRFPDEIYSKSPDSHLYKFMRTLLGENGVNWVKKNHMEARIALEEIGVDMFDLDKFFGAPFAFGRIVEESFEEDPYGVIPREQWEQIKAKNSRYRNRALDYMNGARAGNTPLGMRLVAKAGLGHDVEIIENYKYLFDAHADDPLGLDYYGKTLSTEEMVVLPRREVGTSEMQAVAIYGEPDFPTGGDFFFIYNGVTSANYSYIYSTPTGFEQRTTIPFDGTRDHVRLALEAIPQIGPGNVDVQGGPGPYKPWIITFKGKLASRDVTQLKVISNLQGGTNAGVRVTTLIGGTESVDEVVSIPPKDQYSLQQALDRIRAQTTIPTLAEARGLRSRNNWNTAVASSEYTEVVRYVTGNQNVKWPQPSPVKSYYWIESNKEKEGPRVNNDLQYHYTGFHNVNAVQSSSNFLTADGALTPDQVLADYAEPLFVTAATETPSAQAASFVNGIYPAEYKDLPGVPPLRYAAEQYWSSVNRTEHEWLILRLPFVKAVNYLSFDMRRDPVQIDIEYDMRDQGDTPRWVPVKPVEPYSNIMVPPLETSQNSWASLGLTFTNAKTELVWARAVRLRLTRLQNYTGPIQMRNLRIGRNVA